MTRSSGRALALLLVLLVLLGGAAAGGYYWLQQQFVPPGPLQAPVRIQIDPGTPVRGVLTQLGRQGALANVRAVELYLRVHNLRPNVHFGMYEIPARASPAQILEMFEQGRVVLEQLTVVEGSTFAEFRRELDQHAAVTHTLTGKTAEQVMTALGHPGEFPEGRFFPDTYRFAAKTKDSEILTLAYNAMQKLIETSWPQHNPDLPFDTPYQALILASIVEKETGLPAERPRVAGVFVSRLRKGMRLQSDPTVIYGLGESYDGSIHTRDLVTDTPYNSYTRSGLPPTPIALPGRESVLAAMHAQDNGELYFVATGTGGHHFSKTLEEHNEAVKAYLQHLRTQAR
ncbi:MAG TPA: endolytic transglycosylase MltG [Steroidobacteraceae bacterium]